MQQQGGLSKLIDRQFDAAYNESVIEGDLPDVRWGRIDYMAVTYLTTKWAVWTYVSPFPPSCTRSLTPTPRADVHVLSC